MKKLHIPFLFSLLLLASACSVSSTFVSGKKLMSVQQGMTPGEVRSIFGGEPDFRRFEGGMEEWEYKRYSSTAGGWTIVLVRFLDGRVEGLDSFADRNMNAVSVTTPSPTAVTTIVTAPGHPQVVPQRAGIMVEKEFEDFQHKVKMTVLTNDQKKLIMNAMQRYDFTSEQARELINEIFMSDDKVEMMIKIYPYIVDKRNFNRVIDLLSYSGDKETVRTSIGDYHSKNK